VTLKATVSDVPYDNCGKFPEEVFTGVVAVELISPSAATFKDGTRQAFIDVQSGFLAIPEVPSGSQLVLRAGWRGVATTSQEKLIDIPVGAKTTHDLGKVLFEIGISSSPCSRKATN
jgi:hypothetical protein